MTPRKKAPGFTLIEVIVSVTVSGFTLAATLAVVLFITRTGVAAGNYASQAADARRAMETFARDVRQASGCTYNSATSLTLTVPDRYPTNNHKVTYAYDGANSFQTTVGTTTTTLCRNVTQATFACYTRDRVATTSASAMKLVQLTIGLRQTAMTTVAQDTLLLSSSYVLRNKASN